MAHGNPGQTGAHLMNGVPAFTAPITAVLEFLSDLLNSKDLDYRTIAVYKSAVSQSVHDPVGSIVLGDHQIASSFWKEVSSYT